VAGKRTLLGGVLLRPRGGGSGERKKSSVSGRRGLLTSSRRTFEKVSKEGVKRRGKKVPGGEKRTLIFPKGFLPPGKNKFNKKEP